MRVLATIVTVASLCCVGAPTADACGDKFLVGNIALTQRDLGAIVPVSILVYSSDITVSMQGSDIAQALTDSGHRLAFASGTDALTESLRAERFDIVLTDYRSAKDTRDLIQVNAPDAIILPVLLREDRPNLSLAKSEFGVVLSVPTGLPKLLSMIDKALLLKL